MNMSKSRDIQAKMPSLKVIYASNESKSVLARNLEECRDNDKNRKACFYRLNAFWLVTVKVLNSYVAGKVYMQKKENRMLNIFYGDMKEAVYNTAAYFKYDYEDSWIIDPFVKEMIQDVDRSTVLDSGVIDSPVLGKIPPTGLSGGVKTLILVKFEKDKIFNASTCGDNCAKWLLKIAASEDRTINLHHLMEFGEEPFQIRILNTDQVVCSMRELISIAGEFV